METLGYIYGIMICVFNKKISVEEALEIIRAKLLEQDKDSGRKHITPHKKRKVA